MPGYMKPARSAGASDFEQFAHEVFREVLDGHGTVHARRAKLLQVLTELAKENYDAGVADGKAQVQGALAQAAQEPGPAATGSSGESTVAAPAPTAPGA